VALRRLGATAALLGEKKIERRSRRLARSLSPLRQLEIDRQLLSRVRALGLFPEDAASSLEARWDVLYETDIKKARRVGERKAMRRLRRRLRRRIRSRPEDLMTRLEAARRWAESRLIPPSDEASDRKLHRYRIAVKKARYLSEDLAAAGVAGLEDAIAREKELQDALGRWNDVRLFRERLMETRAQAEERGAVTLAFELDPAIIALEGTIATVRREALALARGFTNVLAFERGVGDDGLDPGGRRLRSGLDRPAQKKDVG
jgi:CHAD domain-containing protein